MSSPEKPLWEPSAARRTKSKLAALQARVAEVFDPEVKDFASLHRFSVERQEDFWGLMWDELGIRGERGARVLAPATHMRDWSYFPDARLNVAETLLAKRGDTLALISYIERGLNKRMSWDALCAEVSLAQQALRESGVGPGDRVAFMLPNIPEAIVLMLAAASLGALIASVSPDFGVTGILDRFGQIEPKVLVAVDGYIYNDKRIDTRQKAEEVYAALPSVELALMVRLRSLKLDGFSFHDWHEVLNEHTPEELVFTPMPFDAPLFVMFSSGTTGKPKCIVHRAGGALMKQMVEHRYHCDLGEGDRVFYFTTCGWMMWNWLVAGLALGETLVLYDGSPFSPSPLVLWEMAEATKLRFFGTSAKYIDALAKAEVRPGEACDLSALELIGSTGSPLVHESFDYVYTHIKPDLALGSMAGGTDIVSCFVAGRPNAPVYRGQIQGPVLGMDVKVFNEAGEPAPLGEKGELVCTAAFPSMPLTFWGEGGQARYSAAYYERFPGVWHHGDFIERTREEGFIIHGRSDATLNPGGVRIGTAEIYRQVEQFDEVVEALVCGQDWQGDMRVVLFLALRDGLRMDEALHKAIRDAIRSGASPRHVPAKIITVPEIPRTRSGKIVELAVRELIHGRPVKNLEALANPHALSYFEGLKDLES